MSAPPALPAGRASRRAAAVRRGRLLVVALAALSAAPASAQMLPSGTWTGTLTGADGDRQPVEADVARCAGGFALRVDGRTADVPDSRPAVWQRGRLRFATTRLRLPGSLLPRPLVCDLRADEDGRLGGVCTSGRRPFRLEIAPPPDAAAACD